MNIMTTIKTSTTALAFTIIATTSFASVEPQEIYNWRTLENVQVEKVVSNQGVVSNESVKDIYANARGTAVSKLRRARTASANIMAFSHNKYAN